MKILKERSAYLDDKSGGSGLIGWIIRLFSEDARNYNKGRCGEDIVTDTLQGLDDSCYLINDVILSTSTGNIDHVLLTPQGIFAIETKHWDGEIICHGDDWLHSYQRGRYHFGSGSPSRQVKRNAFNLSSLIESEVFHNTFKIWVEGLVVFTHPNVQLELTKPTVTILTTNELFNYIVNFRQMCELSKNDLQSIGYFIAGIGKDRPVVPHEESLRPQRNNQDRILRILIEHGGPMGRSELNHHVEMNLSELDAVLQELERAGKVKLTEIKGCRVGGFGKKLEVIEYLSQPPEKIPKTQPPSILPEMKRPLQKPSNEGTLPSLEEESRTKSWWRFWK